MRASILGLAALLFVSSLSVAQVQPARRGSIVEDRAARKLIEAGDARFEVEELKKKKARGGGWG